MSEPAIRASDAERERAIEHLRAAAGEGRLTLEELADRIEAVGGPVTTREELARVTADLPAPDETARDVTTVPTRNTRVFGDQRRSGPWTVPERSRWETVFGDVQLDLREARVPGGELEIEARTIFGDIVLLVPEGVLVEVRASTMLGDVKQDAGMVGPAGAPRIVLTGTTFFGDVRVRARRLRERIAERLRGGS